MEIVNIHSIGIIYKTIFRIIHPFPYNDNDITL